MRSKYQLIIWDLDGTLLDTSEGIISASKYIIEKYGFKIPSDDVFKSFIGPPLQHSFIRVFNVDEEKAMEMTNEFRLRYMERDLLRATPYDGILSLVREIFQSGAKQGIATYKRQDLAERLLGSFGFTDYMDMIYGSDFEGKLTKRDIIGQVIKASGVEERDKIVMIGDAEGDQRGAAQAGVDFIGVTYGFGFKSGKHDGTVKLANSTAEIKDMLGK